MNFQTEKLGPHMAAAVSGIDLNKPADAATQAALTGVLFNVVDAVCPAAEYTGIALEFGTVPLPEVMLALRAEGWLHRHPEAPAELAAAIRRQMRDSFYVDNDAWKEQVGRQSREAVLAALEGLR